MCEFIIKKRDGNKLDNIAEGIVFGKIENTNLVFRGLGIEKEISGGLITEFNVIAEESAYIEIIESPIIQSFLIFVKKIQENKKGTISKDELATEWEKIDQEIRNILNQ
ncbi:MAG: hypothetical protein ACTSPY_14405 [Candidatus Helarchaeota archaeon]